MHERWGNFCIFLLKIAEKEGKTDLHQLLLTYSGQIKLSETAP